MANATLLSLVNAAQGELGLPVSATIIGNAAADAAQLRYLVNAVGQEIRRQAQWQAATVAYTFTTPFYTYTATTTDDSTTLEIAPCQKPFCIPITITICIIKMIHPMC